MSKYEVIHYYRPNKDLIHDVEWQAVFEMMNIIQGWQTTDTFVNSGNIKRCKSLMVSIYHPGLRDYILDMTQKILGLSVRNQIASGVRLDTQLALFKIPKYKGDSIIDGLKSSIYGPRRKWPSNHVLEQTVGSLQEIAEINGIDYERPLLAHMQMLSKLKTGCLRNPRLRDNSDVLRKEQ